MKSKSYIWTYLVTLTGGILLLALRNKVDLFSTIVFIIGLVFLLGSAVILAGIFFPGKKRKAAGIKPMPAIWLPVCAGFLFGVLLICMPDFFSKYLVYTFGVMMVVLGIVQIAAVSSLMRKTGLTGWFLPVPVMILAAGAVIMFLGPEKVQNVLMVLSGIVLICYSCNGFLSKILVPKMPKTPDEVF